jgi:hypothetical protein
MRALTLREVRDRLASEGLEVPAEAAMAGAAGAEAHAPWFVAVLAGAGGWVAAALLGVGLVALLEIRGGALLASGIVLVAGSAAGRFFARGAFATQLALALSVAGQGMIAARVLDGARGSGPWLVLAALEAILVVAFADPVHRFLSTLAAAVCLRVALGQEGLGAAAPIVLGGALLVLWGAPGHAFRPPVASALRRPLGYGVAAAFLGSFLWSMVEHGALWSRPTAERAAAILADRNTAAGVAAVVLGVAGARTLARLRVTLASSTGTAFLLGGAALVALGTRAPGVPAALAVMAIAVEAREAPLFWLGAAAGTGFLSWWYYDLSVTLLAKSALLVASGLVLLLVRLVARRRAA